MNGPELEARIKAALENFGTQEIYIAGLRYDDPAPGRQYHTSKLRDTQFTTREYDGERWETT